MSVQAGWQQGRAMGADECDVKSEDMAGCQLDTSRTRHSLPAPSVPSAAVTVPQEPRAGQARHDRDGGTATMAHASCHPLMLLFGTPGWSKHTCPLCKSTRSSLVQHGAAGVEQLSAAEEGQKSGDRNLCGTGP